MYIRKSKIENLKPLEDYSKGKVVVSFNGQDAESIWVAKDEENKVMFLLNHSVGFFPMPSWGTELPLCESMDLGEMRGEKISDTDITVHPKAYEFCQRFLNEDDSVDLDKYQEAMNEAEDASESEDDAEIVEDSEE